MASRASHVTSIPPRSSSAGRRNVHHSVAKRFVLRAPRLKCSKRRVRANDTATLISVTTRAACTDCYVAGEDPLHVWAFERPHVEQVGRDTVQIAPIEYVILRKLSYFQQGRSDRHSIDVAKMARIRGDLIDRRALDSWLTRLGLEAEWQQALNFNDVPDAP